MHLTESPAEAHPSGASFTSLLAECTESAYFLGKLGTNRQKTRGIPDAGVVTSASGARKEYRYAFVRIRSREVVGHRFIRALANNHCCRGRGARCTVLRMSRLTSREQTLAALATILVAGPWSALAQESLAADPQVSMIRGESLTPAGDSVGSNWIIWSPGLGPAREVVAAVGPDRHAIAWSAPDETGRARIYLAESNASAPLARASVAFDDTLIGENREPSLAYAPESAECAAVWVNRTPKRQALFFYDPALSKSVVVAASADSSIEAPTVTWLDANTPAISWVEVSGSSSTVYAAWRFGEEWETRRASTDEHPYDLMPQFLATPSPALWWYSFAGEGVDLRSAEVGLWGVASRSSASVHPAPTNRLPLLFEGGSVELPAAAWIEALPNGEVLLKYDPTRPLESAFSSASVNEEARPFDPAGAGQSLAWIEETADTRRVQILRADGSRGSLPATESARQLRMAAEGTSELLVWIDATTDGGSGAVRAAIHRVRPVPEATATIR